MRNFIDDLSLKDRDVYQRWVGGLAGFCGALLMVVIIGLLIGNQLSGNPAYEPPATEAVSERPGASIDTAVPVRRVAKDDWCLLRAPFGRAIHHRG
jgi:hypothetical protein